MPYTNHQNQKKASKPPEKRPHFERATYAAFLRMRRHTQEEAAAAIGSSARSIRDWEKDTVFWEACRAAARVRWYREAEDTARMTLLTGLGRDPNLAMDFLTRVDEKLAPPKQKLEHSGELGFRVAVVGPRPMPLPIAEAREITNGNGNGNGHPPNRAAVVKP